MLVVLAKRDQGQGSLMSVQNVNAIQTTVVEMFFRTRGQLTGQHCSASAVFIYLYILYLYLYIVF